MAQIVYKGRINSSFEGFDDGAIFKMENGTYWVQDKYRYWYHYSYRPHAVITEENGRYIMTVEGESIPVKRIFKAIESNIDGEFDGWDGNKKYKLTNGQVWEQAEYKYEYKYAYRPEVIIAEINGSYVMRVEGTQVRVRRVSN